MNKIRVGTVENIGQTYVQFRQKPRSPVPLIQASSRWTTRALNIGIATLSPLNSKARATGCAARNEQCVWYPGRSGRDEKRLEIEAARATSQDAAMLTTTSNDLDELARNIVDGNVASWRDLELAFARADLALAAHYRTLASEALAGKDRSDAGRWLRAAGDSVDEAVAWTGQSPSGAEAQAWDQMHALQEKIRTSANWSAEEARKGIGHLGTQIQYLGQQMQNFSSSAKSNNQ